VCTEGDYPKENVDTKFPPFPAWKTTDAACAKEFAENGGYGEMTVEGKSVHCEAIDDGMGQPLVFNRVKYCPLHCGSDPKGPGCTDCTVGSSGAF
jgi:hypothetical protein